MTDCREIVLKALYTALGTATGRVIYTKIPKLNSVPTPVYPYIHISDVFEEEEGAKNGYQFKFQILIEVVHKDELSDIPLFNDIKAVKTLINNSVPFALSGGFAIMDMRLVSSTQIEVMTDTGIVDVGAIRITIRVE